MQLNQEVFMYKTTIAFILTSLMGTTQAAPQPATSEFVWSSQAEQKKELTISDLRQYREQISVFQKAYTSFVTGFDPTASSLEQHVASCRVVLNFDAESDSSIVTRTIQQRCHQALENHKKRFFQLVRYAQAAESQVKQLQLIAERIGSAEAVLIAEEAGNQHLDIMTQAKDALEQQFGMMQEFLSPSEAQQMRNEKASLQESN
jgi:hypothetical protein